MYKANIIKVQLLMFVLCGMQCSLFGMLSPENNKQTLGDLIIMHGLSHDDYDLHRTCAMLNKKYNKFIEDTYRLEKKLIENHMQESKDQLGIAVTGLPSWDKKFNRCAWISRSDSTICDDKKLYGKILGISHCGSIMGHTRKWDDFYFSVFEDNDRSLFDKDGRACFYGVGKWENKYYSLIEYCLNLYKIQKPYLCSYTYFTDNHSKYGNSTITQPMLQLLNFPVLLKAFLQSKKSVIHDECCRRSESNNPEKSYHITGITLPENYKTYKKCMALEQHGLFAYDSLEDDLIKALEKRYETQQQEKNSGDEK